MYGLINGYEYHKGGYGNIEGVFYPEKSVTAEIFQDLELDSMKQRGNSEKDQKTVWFNSRFYRANLLWDKGTMRFRDIHLFDESVASDYLTKKGT